MNQPLPQTLIERHPSWLKVFASPHPFLNIAYALPLMVWFAQMTVSEWSVNTLGLSAFFALGVLYWSFIEYGIHRWIYHGTYRSRKVREVVESFHIYHHRNLEDSAVLTAGPMMIYPLTAILMSPVWYLVGENKDFFGAMGLGVISYYLFYEWVHFSIHRRDTNSKYMRWITEYHLDHHKRWNLKFGNTTNLWDVVFATQNPKAIQK
jgi:4-hydroxysphinganine ceramide fatty acyl 2-hydroxylase